MTSAQKTCYPPAMPSPKWNTHEMSLLTHLEVFQHKPALLKKAEGFLDDFKDALAEELAVTTIPLPKDTDTTKGQIARGENNKGFPFLSLDIPQRFSKTEMFTLRTLFWWGHYLGFFLILKGEFLNSCLKKLVAQKNDPVWESVLLSTAATPWEWGLENFISVTSGNEDDLKKIVAQGSYMKLGIIYPMNDPTFPALDWTGKGLKAWKTLSSIVPSPE